MKLSEADKYALSQEANKQLCVCLFEDAMMGQVPEGSFCPFCGWRRYESVIVKIAQLEANYNELIFAVVSKHPGETRHETALHYIQEREQEGIGVAANDSPE